MLKKLILTGLIIILLVSLYGCSGKKSIVKEEFTPKLMSYSDVTSVKKEYSVTEFQKWGYVNSKGEWIIQPNYSQAGKFADNDLAFAQADDGLFGYINQKGEWIIQPAFTSAGLFNDKGIAIVANDKKLYGMINSKGEWIVQPNFRILSYFINNRALASTEVDKYGYIDETGKWLIEPKYSSMFSFSEDNIAIVKEGEDGLYGVINSNGEYVIEPKYKTLSQWGENGLAVASIDGEKYGFIDKKGNWAINPDFTSAQSFTEGVAAVCNTDKLWGFINGDGKYVLEAKYLNATPFNKVGLAAVQNGKDNWLIVNGKFETLVDGNVNPPTGIFAIGPSKEVYAVMNGEKLWGCMNNKGEWIVQPVHEGISFMGINFINYDIYDANKVIMIFDNKGKATMYNFKGEVIREN